jgi:hypothetical protein
MATAGLCVSLICGHRRYVSLTDATLKTDRMEGQQSEVEVGSHIAMTLGLLSAPTSRSSCTGCGLFSLHVSL